MKAGNAEYLSAADLPAIVPVFPLREVLLLPRERLTLNVFESRYMAMIDHVLSGQRLIGMVQPRLDGAQRPDGEPELCSIGCLGRLVSVSETGDGRYLIALNGICRFKLADECTVDTPFRQARFQPFEADLSPTDEEETVDRPTLLDTFRAYLKAHDLEADWESIDRAENTSLVNGLSMMAPYGAAEKQALLEAPNLKVRAETLIALTELMLTHGSGGAEKHLQ